MAGAAVLYTPDILGLATRLAAFPWDDALPLRGDARSRSCGSTIALALAVDEGGRIERVAVRSQACAIGQAAAAVFAEAAPGMTGGEVRNAREAISRWLASEGPMPDWPGLAAIAPAHGYPGRHGAILLAWQAASELLP